MNHDPKNKRSTQRRLNVEMMETRLMLSVSPTGMASFLEFTDVEIIPSPIEDSHPVDLLDFGDMAAQFSDSRLTEQISQIVPMPELPKNEDGPLDLQNPVTFIDAAAGHGDASVYSHQFSVWLSDGAISINWNALTAEGQDSDRVIVFNSSSTADSSITTGKSAEAIRDPEIQPSTFHPETDLPLDRVEEKTDRTSFEDDLDGLITRNLDFHEEFQQHYYRKTEDSLLGLKHNPGQALPELIRINTEGFVFIGLGNFGTFYASEFTFSNYNPLSNYDLGDDVSLDDLPTDWANESEPVTGLGTILPGKSSSPWDVPPPPSTSGNNIPNALQTTASMFYQELFDGYRTSHSNDASRLMSSTNGDNSSQTSSFMQQYTNDEEEVYEENSLFTQLGNDTLSEMDTEELALSRDKKEGDPGKLEIEGLIETELNEMLIDNSASNSGEDGIVDISVAMNLSQKPIEATPEGIVEASLQQDEKVAFEGLYGQGQTFELANVEEEEAFSTEDSNVGEVSPKVLDILNQTPLNASNQKNLDNTDLNPSAHEMALGQVTGELDYASMLPSDALSWATFAFVGQHTTRHPDDRKKKK